MKRRMPWHTREGSKLCRTNRMRFPGQVHEDIKHKRNRRNSKPWRWERKYQIGE